MMSGASDAMSFFGRLSNVFSVTIYDMFMSLVTPSIEAIIKERLPDLPPYDVRSQFIIMKTFLLSGIGRLKFTGVLQLGATRRLSQANLGENHRHWRNIRVHGAQTTQQGYGLYH